MNIDNSSELPSGEIIFFFDGHNLTFSDVLTPSLEQLTAPTGRILPFVKFDLDDSACTSECTLSGLSYKWMKKTSTGWTSASLTELSLLVGSDGASLGFRVDNDITQTAGITLPMSSLNGTITWEASNATLSGVTDSEFENLTTTQLCNIGLSYDDKLGMRYFENINDASGTCSGS